MPYVGDILNDPILCSGGLRIIILRMQNYSMIIHL